MEDMEAEYATTKTWKDAPFELHSISDYDIYPEEVEDVAYIWTRVKERSCTLLLYWTPDVVLPEPTIRMVEWWAKVMRMCPSLKLAAGVKRIRTTLGDNDAPNQDPKYWAAMDVYAVASAYHTRDLQNLLRIERDQIAIKENKQIKLGAPVTFEDLDGCLAYAPWAEWDQEGEYGEDDPPNYYIKAIAAESIPPLKPFNPDDTPWLVKLFAMKQWLPDRVATDEVQKLAVEQYLQLEAWPDMFYMEWTSAELVEAKITSDPKKFPDGFVIQDIGWKLPSQSIGLDKFRTP